MKKKILYVEDEPSLAKIVSETLETKGFDVMLVQDGAKVMQSFAGFTPDLCILDVMLPHVDGFALGKEIRTRYPDLPILFLTAKTQTRDVLEGFASGGTEYMRKPFSMEELTARIQNQLNLRMKNLPGDPEEGIPLGQFIFYPGKLTLERNEAVIRITNREAEILRVFARNINRQVDRRALLLEVWGDDSLFHSRNLDVYIRKLREYFSGDSGIEIITLKGRGYRISVPYDAK